MHTEDTGDRREYYRIEDRIALEILPTEHAETVSDMASSRLFGLLGELHQLDLEAQLLLRQIAESNRTLGNYLKVQNKRIDLLGQLIARELLDEIGPAREVVLSEGGISFTHDRPLAEGSVWKLKLILMPQGLGMLLTSRVSSCQAQEDGTYAIGTCFEALTDAQRQMLARHILQKQAAERRLAREKQNGI